MLGYGNHRQAVESHVDADDVQKLDTLTPGGRQMTNHINESGLYALIFGSTKDEAKRFKKWVTSYVLPTIRKTGKYEAPKAKEQTGLDKLRIASALEKAENVAARLCDRFKNLGVPHAQQVYWAHSVLLLC